MTAEKSKGSLENLLDDNLAGLIIPEQAPVVASSHWLLFAVLLIVIAFGLWKWLQFRKQYKQKALRKITLLQRDLSQLKPQQAAKQLATILSAGLKVTRLSLYFPNEKVEQWQAFKQKLDTACYSTQTQSKDELAMLIKQSRTWLKQS